MENSSSSSSSSLSSLSSLSSSSSEISSSSSPSSTSTLSSLYSKDSSLSSENSSSSSSLSSETSSISAPEETLGLRLIIHEESLTKNIKIIGYYTAKSLSERIELEELQENGKNLELSSKDIELEFSLNDNVELEDLYYEVKDLMKKLSSKSVKGFVVLEDIILNKDDILSKFIPLLNIEEASNSWLSLSDKSTSVHTRLTSNPLAYKKALFNFNKDKELNTKKKTKKEIKKDKQVEMDKKLEIDQYDPLALTALNFDAETFK